jgi:hypothetical protein
MVRELVRDKDFKTLPLFSKELGQYDVQTVNFRASKKDPSIAAIEPSQKTEFRLVPFGCCFHKSAIRR